MVDYPSLLILVILPRKYLKIPQIKYSNTINHQKFGSVGGFDVNIYNMYAHETYSVTYPKKGGIKINIIITIHNKTKSKTL